MPTGDDPVLDPQAVLRTFSSKLRGYDSDEVDAHLRSIAGALRARAGSTNNNDDLDEAEATIDRLTAEIEELRTRLADAESAATAARKTAADEPFDEHRAMQLLGEETTRVLETARQSAATIVANAEAEAADRTTAVEELETRVQAELAELRSSTEAELAESRASTEDALAELRTTTEAELADRMAASKKKIAAQQAAAEEEAAAIVADAEAKAADLKEASEAASNSANEEAAALVAAATAEGTELRTAAADEADAVRAEAETEAARVRAEAEADALSAQESARETARLMVVEAQRVREKVLSDLVVRRRHGRQQVDQAKAARDRLARALQEVRRQLDASANELDVALPEAKAALNDLSQPEAPTNDEAQIKALEAELDAARSRAGGDDTVVATGSAALAPARKKPAAESSTSVEDAPTDADSESAVHDSSESSDVETGDADTAEDADEVEEIEVPPPFEARDVAMTRFGADLRRKLKRVMADEQSDLLDRLQRSKKLSVDDLAAADVQRQAYVDAVTPALRSSAKAGAAMHDGSLADGAVDELIEQLVAEVFDPLRARVEESVATADDIEEVLEPLRAHYRDVRLSDVPGLTDDAMAEAFALGAYLAISDGTPVRWISDPRFEPSSDCFDDTLADDVEKPNPFPTGRTHPTGQPGCRCLVVPADTFG